MFKLCGKIFTLKHKIGFKSINKTVQLSTSWKRQLLKEFSRPYMVELRQFLVSEKQSSKQILPDSKLWFNALNITKFEDVKVVILGQDPYPTPGHAHGLCFSVLPDVKPIPKSLINIFKELEEDLGIHNTSGYLQNWAVQGVLLLNSVLTVVSGQAGAHQGKGWENFTDVIISRLNNREKPIVFILWGAYAQKKGMLINKQKHLVINTPHPSPLSAHRGFFGSKPFSKTNNFLKDTGGKEINWST